jgi:hypothetical protein
MSFNYSTASWRWIVLNGKEMVADFATKAEADRYAAQNGGTVKKTRW